MMSDEQKKVQERNLTLSVINEVKNRKAVYDEIADFLRNCLLPFIFPRAQKIQARPKTMESIAGKILKKYIGLKDKDRILDKFTDLVAARLIFLRRDQVEQADRTIRYYFNVDDTNSQDVAARLNEREFGYLSRHYIVMIDQKWLEDIKKKLNDDENGKSIAERIDSVINILNGTDADANAETNGNKKVKSVSVEIQVRTWLQHVWADLTHDSIYKGNREIPEELRRSWNAIAAVLENTDNDIMNSMIQLERYQSNNAYYIADELEKKIENLEIIAAVQLEDDLTGKDKEKLAGHLKDTRDELKRLYSIRGVENEILLKDISAKLKEGDASVASCAKEDDALGEWEKEPTNPRKLLSYLCAKEREDEGCKNLLSGDVLLTTLLRFAIQRCDDMIKTSSDLPWAFAGKAAFQLILLLSGKRGNSPEQNEIDSVFDTILRLINLCNVRSVANLSSERIVATADSRKALENLIRFAEPLAGLEEPRYNGAGSAPLMKCVKMLLELGKYAHLQPGSSSGDQSSDQKNGEASPSNDETALTGDCSSRNLRPTVLVAGGCDFLQDTDGLANLSEEELDALKDFKVLFEKALEDGKNGIDIYTEAGERGVWSLDFNPDKNDQDKNRVYRFGIRKDEGELVNPERYEKYSVYEALCKWAELERKHCRFDDVALVGFGLGRISRLECCIALALGARVTVVRHNSFHSHGRTFDSIPFWSGHPSLVRLPLIRGSKPRNGSFESICEEKEKMIRLCRKAGFPEPMMLRVFMLFQPYHREDYTAEGKTFDLTLLIHRIKALRTLINPDDLNDLAEEKKLSEQHRLLFFKTLRDDAGIRLPVIPPESVPEYVIPDGNDKKRMRDILNTIANYFTRFKNVDYYAFGEREHARWYIERWLQGTRYDSNKIDRNVPASQKKSPCMVAWYDLDDDTILKDTEFLNRYVIALALGQIPEIIKGIDACFPPPPQPRNAC